MSMTDLEICKRIAEIEKIHVSNVECGMYDPLTDKALCFDLMVKYKVVYLEGEAFADCLDGCSPEGGGYYCEGTATDTNPQKAICLAIIEAKGGS